MSNINNPVAWFEIYVNDMQRARNFYETVFQIKLEELKSEHMTDMEYYMFNMNTDKYGCCGALIKMDGVCAGANSTVVYFSCQDCFIEESRVVEAGGSIKRSKMSIGKDGFTSLIIDTEGNLIGLHSCNN